MIKISYILISAATIGAAAAPPPEIPRVLTQWTGQHADSARWELADVAKTRGSGLPAYQVWQRAGSDGFGSLSRYPAAFPSGHRRAWRLQRLAPCRQGTPRKLRRRAKPHPCGKRRDRMARYRADAIHPLGTGHTLQPALPPGGQHPDIHRMCGHCHGADHEQIPPPC